MSERDKELINWLRLIRTPKLGPISCFELFHLFGSSTKALDFAADLARRRKVVLCSQSTAEDELAETRRYGGEIISFADKCYPQLLRRIHAPPPVISIMGNVELLQAKLIAIVGSRNASINGKQFSKMLTQQLGGYGIEVVSGMANGIDTAVHTAAVEGGHRTIAVLGSGINVIYPKTNSGLYDRIAQSNGAVISEFAFGEQAKPDNFPRRNRIISGLSRAVVVVEAGLKSGSLITASFAISQNREVFAVPGSPFSSVSVGTNKLIKDGAHPLTSVDDIISNHYVMDDDYHMRMPDEIPLETQIPAVDLELLKRDIMQAISHSGTKLELIFSEFGTSPAIYLALLELELDGKIVRDMYGNVFDNVFCNSTDRL